LHSATYNSGSWVSIWLTLLGLMPLLYLGRILGAVGKKLIPS
jgi:hypothetical protein